MVYDEQSERFLRAAESMEPSMHSLICADVVEWTQQYTGPLFHAALFDPPYHLTSITKRFGKEGSKPAQHGEDGAFARVGRGFMNQLWDGGDLIFRPETWESLGKVLYPGAFGMAFASSRGWHRMACAIEDAGFIIHPSIFLLGWATAQGFPKATNPVKGCRRNRGIVKCQNGEAISNDAMVSISLEERAYWRRYELALVGYRYGAQAIKPAMEPIVVFQKPYAHNPLTDIVETGAGALNIDAGRLATHGVIHNAVRGGLLSDRPDENPGATRRENELGRWPANFVLIHHPGCKCVGVKTQPRVGGDITGPVMENPKTNKIFGEFKKTNRWIGYGNPDGTETVEYWDCHEMCEIAKFNGDSRFYYQGGWADEVYEMLVSESPVLFEQKATPKEREAGLDDRSAATTNDGRNKPIDNPYQRGETERKNIHPTIKPLALTQWLASLLLPPSLYAPRRLFVPFAGVGSEMIGGLRAGWEEVVGVERQEEYVSIGEQRIAYWKNETPSAVTDQPIQQSLF